MEISRRTYRQFFSALGFDENPFQYTNADEEDRLADYFVPPTYFPSVFGDPEHPKSFVVFAPRGGGKTAQRRMIESNCATNSVLSITYDRFEFPEIKKASDISLSHHLKNILRFVLMGLLVTLHDNPSLEGRLTKYDKEVIVKLSVNYLGGINEINLQKSLDALKSLKDKVREFWDEWLPLLQLGLSTLLNRLLGIEIGSLEKYSTPEANKTHYLKYQLELVISLAKKLGFKSIYVLIDRVDEAELTGNNSQAAFQLLEPLLRDLELLELNGMAFKFFLWDRLEPFYSEIARTDRIQQETLEWDDNLLTDMWKRRLRAFSNDEISGLADVSLGEIPNYSPDELALIFAHQSPRDMIRVGAQIVAEQQEIDFSSTLISSQAIYRGIEKFCHRRSSEVVTVNVLSDLRKIQQVDFTIPHLANNVFREKQSTTRNRLMRWRREGAIVEIERVDNPDPQRKTQVKIFAIQDIRVAKVIHSELDILEFLKRKYRKCPVCKATLLRDWGDEDSATRCHECQFDLTGKPNPDTWEAWKRIAAAKDYRKRMRKEQAEPQLAFDWGVSNDTVV